ncbi:MAG: glycoside hydrolase family 88 protein, partial [bacterium]|nr:glycoside hydrolase family 88 protein [bacterium]
MTPTPLEKVTALADAVVGRQLEQPVAKWMWGPALQGWAFALLQERVGERRYEAWIERFCGHYLRERPAVHSSDTVAPALVTYELERQGDARFAPLTEAAVGYLRALPRLEHGAADHLGTSGYARWYPDSAWIDSIMMLGVLASRWGADHGDREVLGRAAAMPGAYARLLKDQGSGLWAHSWWFPGPFGSRDSGGRRFPRGVAWARGNAWVVAALPLVWESLGG